MEMNGKKLLRVYRQIPQDKNTDDAGVLTFNSNCIYLIRIQ